MIDRRFRALVFRLWRQHRAALAVMAAGLALFEFVMTRVAPEPGQTGFLGGLLALLPPQVSAVIGSELALASPRGVLAFGFLHPFVLALLSAWTIRVAAASLAGEIGRGTMDLLAARPLPRWAHPGAAWLATAVGLAALTGAGWAGQAIGLQLRPLDIDPMEMLVLPAMAWLLFMAWAGVALFVSALGREAGSAIAWTAGLLVVSFVLEYLARVWSPLAWVRPLSLFTYYRPADAVRHGVVSTDVLCLAAVALVGLGAAIAAFGRRDL